MLVAGQHELHRHRRPGWPRGRGPRRTRVGAAVAAAPPVRADRMMGGEDPPRAASAPQRLSQRARDRASAAAPTNRTAPGSRPSRARTPGTLLLHRPVRDELLQPRGCSRGSSSASRGSRARRRGAGRVARRGPGQASATSGERGPRGRRRDSRGGPGSRPGRPRVALEHAARRSCPRGGAARRRARADPPVRARRRRLADRRATAARSAAARCPPGRAARSSPREAGAGSRGARSPARRARLPLAPSTPRPARSARGGVPGSAARSSAPYPRARKGRRPAEAPQSVPRGPPVG